MRQLDIIRKYLERLTDEEERADLEKALDRLIKWHQMERGQETP